MADDELVDASKIEFKVPLIQLLEDIRGEQRTGFARLEARMDTKANRDDVNELTKEFRTFREHEYQKIVDRVRDLEVERRDRETMDEAITRREEKQSLTKHQRLGVIGFIVANAAAWALVVEQLHG